MLRGGLLGRLSFVVSTYDLCSEAAEGERVHKVRGGGSEWRCRAILERLGFLVYSLLGTEF